MFEKHKVEITMDEFYEAVRLFIHEEKKIVMPMNRNDVTMDVDEHKLTFEWLIK